MTDTKVKEDDVRDLGKLIYDEHARLVAMPEITVPGAPPMPPSKLGQPPNRHVPATD